MNLVKERFGQMSNPEVEDMICNIVRTMAAVYKIETQVGDEKPVMPALEYEVKEPDARAAS